MKDYLNEKQCGNKLVLDKKIPFIYYCVRTKKHKGKHKSFTGYPKTKKIIWWEDYKSPLNNIIKNEKVRD